MQFGKDEYAHRLVALCYINNTNNYKEINHIDGDKTSNDYKNLEWCTRKENNKHAFRIGLRSKEEMIKMANSKNHREETKKRRVLNDEKATKVKKLIDSGSTDREIASKFKVSRGCIYGIRKGLTYKEVI